MLTQQITELTGVRAAEIMGILGGAAPVHGDVHPGRVSGDGGQVSIENTGTALGIGVGLEDAIALIAGQQIPCRDGLAIRRLNGGEVAAFECHISGVVGGIRTPGNDQFVELAAGNIDVSVQILHQGAKDSDGIALHIHAAGFRAVVSVTSGGNAPAPAAALERNAAPVDIYVQLCRVAAKQTERGICRIQRDGNIHIIRDGQGMALQIQIQR